MAPLKLPIARIVVEAGSFPCGGVWPGIPTNAPICLSVLVFPGTTMSGWVSFGGSAKVAAVSLYRQPPQLSSSAAPSEAWTARIAAFEVPPTGWVMP